MFTEHAYYIKINAQIHTLSPAHCIRYGKGVKTKQKCEQTYLRACFYCRFVLYVYGTVFMQVEPVDRWFKF